MHCPVLPGQEVVQGEVLKVQDNGKYLVKFVDYGSEELCDPHKLRKGLFLTDLPVLCFTTQIDNVLPVGDKWEEPVMSFIQNTVVDQVLKVANTQVRETFPIPVRHGYARNGDKIIDV